jgi:hypothetical protein
MAALNILGIGDEEQQRNLLGIPGAQVLDISPSNADRPVEQRDALATLYNDVTGMIRSDRERPPGLLAPIWNPDNPVGTSSLQREPSLTSSEGKPFLPLRTEAYGAHSAWLPPGTVPVTEQTHDAIREASIRLNEELGNVTPTGIAMPGSRIAASARKLRTPGVPEPGTPRASGFSVDTSVLSPNAGTLVGKLGSNADIQLDALGLPAYHDIVPSTRTGPLTEAELRAGAPKGEVFDLSETHRVPEVEQRDLSRIDPYGGRRKGLPAHITAAIEDPELAAKLRFVAEKGANAGGAYWYNAEPLRLAFVKELGEQEGNEIFKRYMSIVGATSAGSEVGQNVRAGSYYHFKERAGEPVQSSKDLISPYGHKMQQAHVSGYRGLGEHGEGTTLNPETQPKRSSFVENLGGNQQPVTIDKHNVRLIAMLSKNPEFLNTTTVADVNYPKLGIVKGESRNWRDEVKSGRITMDQAIEHPHMWQDTPDPVHYGALEAWQQKLAKEMGLTPAQFQAALWVGGGRVTGLRSLPTSFMGIVENRLAQTAQKRGITPQQALQDWITNKAPLLSVGAAGGGLLGIPYPGEEARQ